MDPSIDPDECEMCKRFKKQYPQDNKSEDELITLHFPDVDFRRKGEK